MSASSAPKPFTTFASIAVPIDIANCDTDQIIPARFLRKGDDDPDYPSYLLHDLRFNADGSATDFIYNRAPYKDGRIFVTDVNWGCGSSRESAVTALAANGIRAVIAPSIADIHYNNCVKNGVVPIILSEHACSTLREQLHTSPGAEIAIDLDTQSLTGPDQSRYTFEIDAFDKHRLLNGLDDIGLTRAHSDEIKRFAEAYRKRRSWVG